MNNTATQLEVTSDELVLGLNPPISNYNYHADKNYLSSSVFKTIYKSLEKYYSEYILGEKEPQKDSPSLAEGSLAHTLILEPHMLVKEFNIYPGFDKREKGFQAWKTANDDGRTIVSAAQLNKVQQWVKAYQAHPTASTYIDGGIPEQTITAIWNVETGAVTFDEADANENTVKVKVRFDSVNPQLGFMSDVKTTKDPRGPEVFSDSAFKETGTFTLMYDLSAALYLLVAEAYYQRQLDFYFIVLSKADIACDVYKLSSTRRAGGMAKLRAAGRKLLEARRSNVWTELSKPQPVSNVVEI
jgi:hypothetical protein